MKKKKSWDEVRFCILMENRLSLMWTSLNDIPETYIESHQQNTLYRSYALKGLKE